MALDIRCPGAAQHLILNSTSEAQLEVAAESVHTRQPSCARTKRSLATSSVPNKPTLSPFVAVAVASSPVAVVDVESIFVYTNEYGRDDMAVEASRRLWTYYEPEFKSNAYYCLAAGAGISTVLGSWITLQPHESRPQVAELEQGIDAMIILRASVLAKDGSCLSLDRVVTFLTTAWDPAPSALEDVLHIKTMSSLVGLVGGARATNPPKWKLSKGLRNSTSSGV
ncbi:hypothetical protein BDN71DRAFT_1436889 [Pleurotus eryngii]|uniref:Uncharacterized protein n=1 Tax=Pleurotus eryngii TaxID=5323 RepID=A0A9P5ZH88_PLEER|nr:hypothetical protein BDN71DRAFT_1436889 [Pleurotus eryngii]